MLCETFKSFCFDCVKTAEGCFSQQTFHLGRGVWKFSMYLYILEEFMKEKQKWQKWIVQTDKNGYQ